MTATENVWKPLSGKLLVLEKYVCDTLVAYQVYGGSMPYYI
jgi:hypothetical protein